MANSVPLLEKDQIVVGKPLPFSVFSVDNKLLLAAGRLVESDRVRQMLVQNGAYRSGNVYGEAGRPAAYVEPEVVNGPLTMLRKDFGEGQQGLHRFAVTMAPSETHEAYNAFVVGVHDQSIVLTAPTRPDGSLVAVTAGQTWLCRTFQVTTAFRFRASVLKAAFEPFPHLYLEIPRQVEKRKVRDVARANVFVHGQIEGSTNNPCVFVDLSTGGGRIAVGIDVKMERGAPITVCTKFDLVGHKFDLRLPGSIVGVFGATDARHPKVAFYGVKFDALNERDLLVLHGYVAGHLASELNGLWQVLSAAS